MFLENLVGSEKSAFLGLAQRIVQADGALVPREAQLLEVLEAATEATASAGEVRELASAFRTRQSRVSALLELMGLGLADGEYHPAEKDMIADISKTMGFSEEELLWMEGWVVRQAHLLEEAADFWGEEGA